MTYCIYTIIVKVVPFYVYYSLMHLNFSFLTEFVINPNGKSEVCILHEYMQRVLKVRPVYNFFECGKFFCMCLEVFNVTMSCLPSEMHCS